MPGDKHFLSYASQVFGQLKQGSPSWSHIGREPTEAQFAVGWQLTLTESTYDQIENMENDDYGIIINNKCL